MNHGLIAVDIAPGRLPGGQRRNLVEQYYAAIDLSNPQHVKRLLSVFEDILLGIPIANSAQRDKLLNYLKRDGIEYTENRLISRKLDAAALQAIAGSEV